MANARIGANLTQPPVGGMPSARRCPLLIAVCLVVMCAPALAAIVPASLDKLAFDTAQARYVAQSPRDIAAFDPPQAGTDLGLDFDEANAITSKVPLFDDSIWWAKPRPRANVERDKFELFTFDRIKKRYANRPWPFRAADFDYTSTAIVPALPATLPVSAAYHAALDLGHRDSRASASWPQILHIGSSGYARLSAYDSTFGTSLRLSAVRVGAADEVFPKITRLQLRRLTSSAVLLSGILDSPAFAAAFAIEITPGAKATVGDVTMHIFPRARFRLAQNPASGPLALSSMFWKGETATPADPTDEAHDADVFVVCRRGGERIRQRITVPGTPGGVTSRAFGQQSCFGLIQSDRAAQHYATYDAASYAERSDTLVTSIRSSVPYEIVFTRFFTEYEGADNLVAFVAFTGDELPLARSSSEPIVFSYRVRAGRLE